MRSLAQGTQAEHSPAAAYLLADVAPGAGLGEEIAVVEALAQRVELSEEMAQALTFWMVLAIRLFLTLR